MTSPHQVRSVDHPVLPVEDLSIARARYQTLGFTVAPDAAHPFGTENCCVHFRDGTMLEPLAVGRRETCEAAALRGNTFVRRDQAYRFRQGEPGFSALALGSEDARADDAAFREAGFGGGQMVRFSRRVRNPEGENGEATFELAFAADDRAPDAFFFTCARIRVPDVDLSALQRHENGAAGIAEIVLSEVNPTDFQYPIQHILGQREVHSHSFGIELRAANATVSVLTPDGLKAWYGADAPRQQRGLLFQAVVLAADSLEQTADILREGGIGFERIGPRLVVQPAPGQGAILAFEEKDGK